MNDGDLTNSTVKSKNLAIESLRGIAAMLVVFYHYFGLITTLGLPKGNVSDAICLLASYGHVGVRYSLSLAAM